MAVTKPKAEAPPNLRGTKAHYKTFAEYEEAGDRALFEGSEARRQAKLMALQSEPKPSSEGLPLPHTSSSTLSDERMRAAVKRGVALAHQSALYSLNLKVQQVRAAPSADQIELKGPRRSAKVWLITFSVWGAGIIVLWWLWHTRVFVSDFMEALFGLLLYLVAFFYIFLLGPLKELVERKTRSD
jgi:hypothetical protein